MRTCVSGAVLAAIWATGVSADTRNHTIRPQEKPAEGVIQLASADVAVSVRPVLRPSAEVENVAASGSNAQFQVWIATFRSRALDQGISPATLDQAFRGVTYDEKVVKRDRNQSEFTKTIWEYLDSAVSDDRIRNGRASLERHRATLERIEAKYGVEKEIVTAIWGLESAFGSFRGSDSTIRSLATLAFDARRAEFFEAQLIAALQILDAGDVTASGMRGSWAGAMGHTQFMPTSYLEHAIDFTGDGKRDIWSDDPTDALASTAAYLARHGWTKGQPWGVEVRLPDGFDYASARRELTRLPSEWAASGVVDMAGKPVPDYSRASILLPAGGQGVAFMIFDNFEVLERYNTADAYVIGVGHLADRIAGDGPFRTDWPRGDRALTFTERQELQLRLTRAGYDTQKIDGRIGPLTVNAVREYQLARGMRPDGYASLRLLESMR
ncbi:lytic murein transglycosylase [Ruegeria sediminis]|uniref:Lytic murein transglycosylase n=1 Tax=Ruegeria sediminis TaxID=2583820 RepID=A0ABY2WTT8_9RHOB|nr:lytic murein transglycosylase [Ruegeria sediminis]TMV04933.1 lytic murein transglycosylase [Ruegeria sediminis]